MSSTGCAKNRPAIVPRPEVNPIGLSRFAALLLLAILPVLLATPLVGCSGRCSHLVEEYEAAIRSEMARAGTGVHAISSGEHHLGMTLSVELLQDLLAIANDDLSALSTRMSVEQTQTGYRSAVEILAQPFLERIRMISPDSREVLLECRIEARVTIRAPGNRIDHFLFGSFGIEGSLLFELDPEGTPVLALDLLQYSDQPVVLGTQGLPDTVAQAFEQFLQPALSERLFAQVRRVRLARFPPLLLGSLLIYLAPDGLIPFPADDTLFLGFSTNLRPGVVGYRETTAATVDHGLRLTLHPDLAQAAIRLALAEGRLPRTYDPQGLFDPQGPIRVTTETTLLSSSQINLRVKLWDTRPDACQISTWTVAFSWAEDDPHPIRITPEDLPCDPDLDCPPFSLDPSSWLLSPFVQDARTILERMLVLPQIEVGRGRYLELVPEQIRMEEDRMEVDLVVVSG
ncbi:MAG: hypothetical protein JW797_07230 [Bradymonadales bacterium]|nr:hypothetical protein [Bradymonadales bacterium]